MRLTHHFSWLTLSAALVATASWSSRAAAVAAATGPQSGQVWVQAPPTGEQHAEVVEVQIVNDDVQVIVNGNPISKQRLKREGDRVIILDEHGNALKTIELKLGDAGSRRRLRFGPEGGDDHVLRWQAAGENEPPKVMLGVMLGEPGPALVRHLRLKPGASTMITGVYKGLPAHRAGVDQYDVVIRIEGQPSANPQSLRTLLRSKQAGEPLELELIHEGMKRQVVIDLDAYDIEKMAEAEVIGDEPDVLRWNRLALEGLKDLELDMEIDGLVGPDGERRLWFAPGENQFFELRPGMRQLDRRFGPPGGVSDHERQARIEAQLGKLEAQLAELSAALERLLKEGR